LERGGVSRSRLTIFRLLREVCVQSVLGFESAIEISEKDGSIVLSAGSKFVRVEVMKAWNKILSVADDGDESRE
jgi:hypothetical protein